MARFITNEKEVLSEAMNNIIPYCDKLYFLIGYFYFTGYKELYSNLDDKHLKKMGFNI